MSPAPTRPGGITPRQWLLLFAVWTGIGLFYFTQSAVQLALSRDRTPLWHPLVSWLVGVYLAALFTPLVLWLGRRFPLSRQHWLGPGLIHLQFSIGYGFVLIGLESMILPRFHVYPAIMTNPLSAFVFLLMIGFHQNIMTYWTILALQAGWEYYKRFHERQREALRLELRAAELQSQLARAQLGALKAQLHPHFLFNTLNAIMTLVRQGEAEPAEKMLGRLADLLRAALGDLDAQEVPLRREMEYLRLYLSIEEVRFQDRLRVDITTGPGLLEAAVPHLCLQPVVENAIRHGVGKRSAAGRIAIRAQRDDDRLVLTVEDDGPGLDGVDPGRAPGIGLANTRSRLAQLYGTRAELRIEPATPTGARVTLVLPYREMETSAEEGERIAYAMHGSDRR